jgi:hypothetical protein
METKIFLAIVLAVLMGHANAGLFGPSNYDDCILDGVKQAKTDLAVQAVYQSCRNKFPKAVGSDNKSPKVAEPCNVYWTGREFKIGSTSGDDSFLRFGFDYLGVEVSVISIPKTMAQTLGVESMSIGSNATDSKKFRDFLNKQWTNLAALCKLEHLK